MLKKDQRYSFKNRLPEKKIINPLFALRYEKNESGFKCAIVVSKKVDKKAVVRNKTKRQISGIIEEITKEKNIPFNMVFFIKKEIIEQKREEIKKEIKEIFEKLIKE